LRAKECACAHSAWLRNREKYPGDIFLAEQVSETNRPEGGSEARCFCTAKTARPGSPSTFSSNGVGIGFRDGTDVSSARQKEVQVAQKQPSIDIFLINNLKFVSVKFTNYYVN